MDTLLHDLRAGLRTLTGRPAFTAVMVLTLGLGLGANTAVFSLVNAVLLRPLPVSEPETLVALFTGNPRTGTVFGPSSLPDFLFYEQRSQTLAGLAALFGVTAHDAPTLLAVTALLIAVGLLAAWRPARRAASIDPAAALRGE